MFVTFFYFCEKLHDMEEYKLINYSDIFLSYFHQVGRECTFRVKNHTLFYVCSGEMEINEWGTVTKFHRGECAFIRRDNRVTLNKRCIEEGKPFISITLIFSRKFLLEFYRSMNKEGVPANIRRSETSLLKIPSRPDVMSLFESIKPYYDSSIEPDEDWIRLKMMEVLLSRGRSIYSDLWRKIICMTFRWRSWLCIRGVVCRALRMILKESAGCLPGSGLSISGWKWRTTV